MGRVRGRTPDTPAAARRAGHGRPWVGDDPPHDDWRARRKVRATLAVHPLPTGSLASSRPPAAGCRLRGECRTHRLTRGNAKGQRAAAGALAGAGGPRRWLVAQQRLAARALQRVAPRCRCRHYPLYAMGCCGAVLSSRLPAGGRTASGTCQHRKQSRHIRSPGTGEPCSCPGWPQAGSTVCALARLVNFSCSGGSCLGSSIRLSHKNFTCLSNASNLLGQSAKSSSAS